MWDGSFHRVTMRGRAGALVLGYRTVATLPAWTIRKGGDGQWVLSATLARADAFLLRQTPLLFTAPSHYGFTSWGVESVHVGTSQLVAKLGPPEH